MVPLRILSVQVTAVDPAVGLVVTPVALDGSTRATTTTSVRVQVDRFLDPTSASRQALCLQSDTAVIRALAECTKGELLRPLYDPVSRTVTYYLESETTRLAPETLYRVTLFEADEDTGNFGLRAFDGATIEGIFAVEFTTTADRPELATEGPPTDPGYCGPGQAREVLQSCTFGGCHRATSEATQPPMGLDLSGPEALTATAIGKPSHQSQRGAGADDPDLASLSFGRAMPVVAPGNPGLSYLLYKVALGAELAADPTLSAGEIDRLRQVVVGAPMPIRPGALDAASAQALTAWIAAGAQVPICP